MKKWMAAGLALLLTLAMLFPALGEDKNSEIMQLLMTMTAEERAAFAQDFAAFMNLIGEGDVLGTEAETPAPAVPRERIQGEGFATAEEAAIAFLQALDDGDYARACRCYAIESIAENVTEDLWEKRGDMAGGSGWTITTSLLPSEAYREWNIASRYYWAATNTMAAAYALSGLEDREPINAVMQLYQRYYPEEGCQELLSTLRAFESASCQLRDYRAEEIVFQEAEEWLQHKEKLLAAFGADDVKAILVRFTGTDGQPMAFLQYAMQYGDAWYLYGADRFLAGTSIISTGGIYMAEDIELP